MHLIINYILDIIGDTMRDDELKSILISILMGFLGFLMLITAVVLSGQTFGQRAAETYEWGTPEWKEEVQRLSDGK